MKNSATQEMEKKIGYQFQNEDLLWQAFTRTSYATMNGGEANENLEFIGDKVLDFYVVKIMMEKYGYIKHNTYTQENQFATHGNKTEEYFTDQKKKIVSNKALAQRIDQWGCATFMLLGGSDLNNQVRDQEKVKADLFEAILGAIAIDCNWDATVLQSVVAHTLQIECFLDDGENTIDSPPEYNEKNADQILKELGDKRKCSPPIYEMPDKNHILLNGAYYWLCTCTVKDWGICAHGSGRSKADAKREAAYHLLCKRYGLPEDRFFN